MTRDVALESAVARLVAGEHHDPHSILGAHPERGGVIVRAFSPWAVSMRVVLAGGDAAAMALVEPSGVFACSLPRQTLPLDYQLEATWPDGTTSVFGDPYSFLPTLGELDLHLIAEGRHERLYEVLGAHERELDGRRRGRRSPSGLRPPGP